MSNEARFVTLDANQAVADVAYRLSEVIATPKHIRAGSNDWKEARREGKRKKRE